MGAPNVDEFLPGPNSIIKVSDFDGPAKLAEYLKQLIENPELYNKYHAWRKVGWSSAFISMLHNTYHSLPCRVCEKVAEMVGEQSTIK